MERRIAYEAPTLTEIGTLHELTLQMNKVGLTADQYSNTIPVVGSLIPAK